MLNKFYFTLLTGRFFMSILRGLTMSDKQWYTNKELFEQINDLTIEMKETRQIIKRYNGLYEKVDHVEKEIEQLKSAKEGREEVQELIHQWGGWIFSFITLIVLLYTTFN